MKINLFEFGIEHKSKPILSKQQKLIRGFVLINEAGFKFKDLFTTKKQLKEMTNARNYIDNGFRNNNRTPKNYNWEYFSQKDKLKKSLQKKCEGMIMGHKIKIINKTKGG